MFTGILVWEPGEIAGQFALELEIVVCVHVDTRVAGVAAWRNSGVVRVPAWKSSLCSRGNSCGSLEK